MKATSRSFVSKNSRARKVVAILASAALVASMSNFQAWNAQEALAAPTVKVKFELDEGITVTRVNGVIQNYTSGSENIYEGTDERLNFEAEVAPEGNKAFKIDLEKSDVSLSNPEAQASLASLDEASAPAEPLAEDVQQEEVYSEFGTDGESSGNYDAVEKEAEFDEQEGQDGLENGEGQDKAVSSQSAPATALQSTQGDTEQIQDDATPQTSGVSEGDRAFADEAEPVVTSITWNEQGFYEVDKRILQEAASQNKTVVVKLMKSPLAEGDIAHVSKWSDLVEAMKSSQVKEARVEESFQVDQSAQPVEVSGKKVLNLNGKTITCNASTGNLKGKALITVPQWATLSVVDEASDQVVRKQTSNKQPIPHPTDANGANNSAALEEAIGKIATYDPQEKKLTYWVTTSKWDEPKQGETTEYVSEFTVSMNNVGAIEGQGLDSLIDACAGTLNIQGGRFTNEGAHAIAVSKNKYNVGGELNMQGGFIVGSTGSGDGAGIYANEGKGSVAISGNAIIAGNVTANNGGGIYVNDVASVSISGDALVAGNKTGTENDTTDNDAYRQAAGTYSEKYSGGGIYLTKTGLELSGDAIVSGNWAARDGGGVYVKGDTSSHAVLTMKEDAIITNNKAMNNREQYHVDGKTKDGDKYHMGGGGGGIFATGDIHIKGGQITANVAHDSGGGIFAPAYAWNDLPMFTMEQSSISSNLCGTSEGGGINGKTAKGSQILTGYITNNVSKTEFDYGGGGLFITSGGEMLVYEPLVTANTAEGFGGGVAACTNGTIITADAAIFNNIAKQSKHTTNGVEFGDQWGMSILAAETVKPEDAAYATKVKQHSSSDYFSAKASTVYNNMLGGGLYNWRGYMTQPTEATGITLEKYKTANNNGYVGFLKTTADKPREVKPFGFVRAIDEEGKNGITFLTLYLERGQASSTTSISESEAKIIVKKLSGARVAYFDGEENATGTTAKHGYLYMADTDKNNIKTEWKNGKTCYAFKVQLREEKYTIERYRKANSAGNEGFLKSVSGRGTSPFCFLKKVEVTPAQDGNSSKVVIEVAKGEGNAPANGFTEQQAKDFLKAINRAPLAIYNNMTSEDIDAEEVERGVAVVQQDSLQVEENTYRFTFSLAQNKDLYKFATEDKKFGPIINSVITAVENAASIQNVYMITGDTMQFAGYSTAERFMALKAAPKTEDIDKAYAKANMYVTGNWSNTNGGGIGCNGKAVIGRDPDNPSNHDDPPHPLDKPVKGELKLIKKINGDTAQLNGPLTAVFTVKGYEKRTGITDGKDKVYDNVIGLSFAAGEESKESTLTNLPEGYYIVEELDIAGDNFDQSKTEVNDKSGRTFQFRVQKKKDDASTVVKFEVTYTNTPTEEGYGSSVVNTYAKDSSNTFKYTQDQNYRNRAAARENQGGE